MNIQEKAIIAIIVENKKTFENIWVLQIALRDG